MISDKTGAYGPESVWAIPIQGHLKKAFLARFQGLRTVSRQLFNRFTGVLRVRLKSYAKARPNGEHPLQHDVFLEK